jgi:hypothetical protein
MVLLRSVSLDAKTEVVAGNVAGIRHLYRYINLRIVDFSISFHDFAFSGLWK